MKHRLFTFLAITLIINIYSFAQAETHTVTICSLNLYRFGEKGMKQMSPEFVSQRDYLVERLRDASCDVTGLQEVVGKKKKKSLEVLRHLADTLNSYDRSRSFKILLADSNDSWNRNAFIYDASLFLKVKEKSWNRQSLPRMDVRSAPWSHTRGPFSLILQYKNNPERELLIINYHLKSKASGWKDPVGTKFEFQRMLAAAGIREIARSEGAGRDPSPYVILLGDRNANSSGAASEVLSGRLALSDFSEKGSCRISPEGTALCPAETYREPDMIPLLQSKMSITGEEIGTFRLGRRLEILDEIYIKKEDYSVVRYEGTLPLAGVIGEFYKGSDHLLSYVELEFKK
jgi:hypothetical protein